ncbi:MAG: hypothetical protein MK085_08695 [Phycisphaerales bacterium]|nr:hypothetical protein [Phycisphaerales bacterium]
MTRSNRLFRAAHGVVFSAFLLPALLVGCEESASTSSAPNNGGGARSTLGKAKESADRTMDKMKQRQEELSKQADDIFDTGN